MNHFNVQIEDIIANSFKNLNPKIKGINYLEMLKFDILQDKLVNINFSEQDINNYEDKVINHNNNLKNLNVSITHSISTNQHLKQLLSNDCLIICLNGTIKIDLLNTAEKTGKTSLNFKRMMGITLPSNSEININLSKNCIKLQIEANDLELNIENS